MYEYKYDAETGGIMLTDTTSLLSKEPRPVYAQELDYLGIDDYLIYEKQQDIPYMWAEAARYIYKGEVIFKTKGGSLYEKPALEFAMKEENGEKVRVIPDGTVLEKIDIPAMVEANRDSLAIIEQITVKKIYDVYRRRKKSLDCFHVAFSGGKDSIVLLELVKKALPRSSYMVVFGDTKMEFPDTYELVDIVEKRCKEEGINFYRAASHFEPEESWRLFGPPSRVLRWCCTVHKAAPQTLKIREVLGKNDYVGLDFVGVRAHESATRATYDEENYGKKQKGQYSHNPILEWTSAEIWLYIFSHNLPINSTYKKGNSRAGCLFCPMGGGKGDFFQYCSYAKEIDKYIDIIKETNAKDSGKPTALTSYVTNGGWNARKNGRDLTINKQHYFEETKDGLINIKVIEPKTDWKEWIKTLGRLNFEFDFRHISNGYIITVNENVFTKDASLKRRFKQVFKKAAYCRGCRVCEMNCKSGCISFKNGLNITNCRHCGQCHEIDGGCLVYNSLKMPMGGTRKMSYNSFANHAPKYDWISDFVDKGQSFWDDNTLGPNQVPMFKKFLKACGIISIDNKLTKIYDLLKNEGLDNPSTWGLILSNFAYNEQCKWYINNMPIGLEFKRDSIAEMLRDAGVSKGDSTSIINAFKRFCELPLGYVLNFGYTSVKGVKIEALGRTKTTIDDERVLLYSLYRYAEACERYYQFNLSTLMDINIDSVGISPVKIFGFDRDEMEAMLRGLSAKYNDFIDADFTHDLEKITLRDYHTSADVLDLF